MNALPKVIEAYLSAYNRRDAAAMVTCLSQDIAFQNIDKGKITAETSGKPAFAELAALGVQAFESRQQTVTNAITVADTTLVEVDYSAVVAIDLPNGWKAGQRLQLRGASAFRVENGKIASIVDESQGCKQEG